MPLSAAVLLLFPQTYPKLLGQKDGGLSLTSQLLFRYSLIFYGADVKGILVCAE